MSQAQKSHYWIREWVRDAEDIRGLLEAYGEDGPSKPDEARLLLLTILNELRPDEAAAMLYQFARGFALMLDDIVDFCEERGIAIAGQIRLPGGEPFGRSTALDTGWARSGRTNWTEDITGRAAQLVAEFAAFGATIRAEDFVDTGEELTDYGRSLQRNPGHTPEQIMRSQVFRGIPGLTHHDVQGHSQADLKALQAVVGMLDELEGSLGVVIPGATDVIIMVRGRVREVIDGLASLPPSQNGKTAPAPELAMLISGIDQVGGALRRLVEQVSEAERDTRGLHDFIRSEFWGERWRIFELWVFVRVLRILTSAGGQLEPLGALGGVWHLPYSKASEPVLLCRFGAETVRVYYQLHREGPDQANMPDIALEAESDRQMVAVIDPKHGPTHTFAKVNEVLRRYASAFRSELTAVVNYTPMQSYGLTNLGDGTSQCLLVSDLAPGTVNFRRFELRLEECIVARFAAKASAPKAVRGTSEGQQHPSHSVALLYQAVAAREVDEPDGLWIVPDGSGPSPVRGLQPMTGLPSDEPILGVFPAPDGRVAVLSTEAGAFMLPETGQPTSLSEEKSQSVIWNPGGDRVFFTGSHRLYDRRGKELGTLPAGMPSDRYRWEKDVLCRLSVQRDGKRELFMMSPDSDNEWRPVADGTRMSFSGAISPSSRRRVVPGPRSMRDAVFLIRILDNDDPTEFPLIRIMDLERTVARSIAEGVAFSPDENRFAFIVGRGEQARVMTAKVGDRYATTASLSHQRPEQLRWISSRLAHLFAF